MSPFTSTSIATGLGAPPQESSLAVSAARHACRTPSNRPARLLQCHNVRLYPATDDGRVVPRRQLTRVLEQRSLTAMPRVAMQGP